MPHLLEPVLDQLAKQPKTTQVEVNSSELRPVVKENDTGRVFCLQYGNDIYPCLEKGWTSWTQHVFRPPDNDNVIRHRKNASVWKLSSIRNFLWHTPLDIVNNTILSWWSRLEHQPWHVVKYEDNETLGAIRYIGSQRYQLYRNTDIVQSLLNMDDSGFVLNGTLVDENCMLIRMHHADPVDQKYNNLFSGIQISNSENGSSAINMRHLIYDLICSNGLITAFEDSIMVLQRHVRFELDKLVDKFNQAIGFSNAMIQKSTAFILELIRITFEPLQIASKWEQFKKMSRVSEKFIDEASQLIKGNRAWDIISAITQQAQAFASHTSRTHVETKAGEFGTDLIHENRAKEKLAIIQQRKEKSDVRSE